MVTTTLNVVIPEEEKQDSNFGFNTEPTEEVGTVSVPEEMLVEAPQEPAQQITSPLPDQEPQPTVVSTDTMRDQLDGAQKTLEQMKAEIEAGNLVGPDEPQPEKTEDKQITEILQPDERDEYDDYAANSAKAIADRKKEFERYEARSDKLLKAQIRSINKTFDVRRRQADEVAQNAKAASQVLGSRSGRQRYAPVVQQGIMTGQENALIKTLAEIDALELAAIATAEEAAYERDYGTFLDQIDNIDTLTKEREATLKELNEVMEAENEKREQEIEDQRNETAIMDQIILGVTDPIEIYDALNGTVPYDLILAYTNTLPEKEDIVLGGGGGTASGLAIGTPSIQPGDIDDVDALNISDAAKNWVRIYNRGEMTLEEIAQRLGTSAAGRALATEIAGAVGLKPQPVKEVKVDPKMNEYMKKQAKEALEAIDVVLEKMGISITELEDGKRQWNREGGIGTEATALSRWLTQAIPGTDSRTISQNLDTVKALIGFDSLADMRAASPTGGALGQITERELGFLQSTQGSLDEFQETEQFVENLLSVMKSFENILGEAEDPDLTVPVANYGGMTNEALLTGSSDTEFEDPNGIY